MQLEDFSPALLRGAVQLYLARAYGDGAGLPPEPGPRIDTGPRIDLGPLFSAEDHDACLRQFQRGDPGDDPSSRRYTLRLGSACYPFMKFVLQEHLVEGEFFFSVDTHDNLSVGLEDPDHARWEALKAYNRALAAQIETDWEAAGLPTHAGLATLLEGVASQEQACSNGQRLLLVDDDRPVCRGLAILLRAQGYEVEELHDGLAALERLAHGPRPDLVLLDYEMPHMDGQAVLQRLRADPQLKDLPVLLATASRIDLSRLERVSGLLHKPYPRQVLFEMIAHLLRR